MESGALSQEAFVNFAKDYVLFVHVTSRVSTDLHQDLLIAKGGQGFPHLAMLDSAGEVIGVHSGPRTVAGFKATGGNARKFLDLSAKVAAGNEGAKVGLLLVRMELGLVGLADAEDEAEGLEMTKEQRARVDQLLLDLEVVMMFESVGGDAGKVNALGKLWLGKAKEGLSPKGDWPFRIYWTYIFRACSATENADGCELALKAMTKHYGATKDPREQQNLESWAKRVKEIRGGQ